MEPRPYFTARDWHRISERAAATKPGQSTEPLDLGRWRIEAVCEGDEPRTLGQQIGVCRGRRIFLSPITADWRVRPATVPIVGKVGAEGVVERSAAWRA